MRSPESRSLEELVTLYELEPGLRDIYVEGSSDQSVLEWYLDVEGLRRVVVKNIDHVEIPAAMVLGRGLEDNQRGRVIALAHYLDEKFGGSFSATTCVADGDFDHINSKTHGSKLVLLTDYTSMEMYFFNEESIKKLLKLALPKFPKTAKEVLTEITPVLETLFLVRMANSRLRWGLAGVNHEKCCRILDDRVDFDSDEYMNRSLRTKGRYIDKAEFVESMRMSKELLTSDPRLQIHGHDFIGFLTWYIRQHKGFKWVRDDMVERALFASAEASRLTKEGLFLALSERLRTR